MHQIASIRIFQLGRWTPALLVGCLLSGTASAQSIVVDPALIGKTAAEYIETAKRWKSQYDHYQQQLIKLRRLNFRMEQMADNFPERDPNEGVEEACPGPGGIGTSIGETIRRVVPNPDQDIVQQQRILCIRGIQVENMQYNETVRMLKRMIQHQRNYQNGIEAQRDSVGSNQGALAANDNETNRLIARMEMDREYWMARNQAFDTYIRALEKEHGRLAKRALNGKKDTSNLILSRLVQAATLEAALSN